MRNSSSVFLPASPVRRSNKKPPAYCIRNTSITSSVESASIIDSKSLKSYSKNPQNLLHESTGTIRRVFDNSHIDEIYVPLPLQISVGKHSKKSQFQELELKAKIAANKYKRKSQLQ